MELMLGSRSAFYLEVLPKWFNLSYQDAIVICPHYPPLILRHGLEHNTVKGKRSFSGFPTQ